MSTFRDKKFHPGHVVSLVKHGFDNFVYPGGFEAFSTSHDPSVEDNLLNPNRLSVVSTTDASLRKAQAWFTKANDTEWDFSVDRNFEKAYHILLQHLKSIGAFSRGIDFSDVEIRPDASSGARYSLLGYQTKGDSISLFSEAMREYCLDPRSFEKPLWMYSSKVEHLPLKKIYEDRQRGLAYPSTEHLILEKMVCGELDQVLKHLEITGYGKTPFFGGFNALMSPVASFPYYGKGDIEKMDVHSIPQQWKTLARLRKDLAAEYLHDRIDFVYEVKNDTLLWLTDGTIIHARHQQKSGSGATSTDNTWWHLIIFIYMVLEAGYEIEDFSEFLKVLWPVMFSDDHVFGTVSKVIQSLGFRRKIYKRFGYTLKPEEDLETEVFTDLSFLGGQVVYHPRYGYVPSYNGEKFASMFFQRESNSFNPEAIYATLLSYCLLTTWSEWFSFFHAMLHKHCSDYSFKFHSRYDFEEMFKISESVALRGPSFESLFEGFTIFPNITDDLAGCAVLSNTRR